MKNVERIIDKIVEYITKDVNDRDITITNIRELKKWLVSEYNKEPVKLTPRQYDILKNAYDNGFYWIAKDSDDGVCVYTSEPKKGDKYFSVKDLDGEYNCIPLWLEPFNDIVSWEGEAVEISEILNNCESAY